MINVLCLDTSGPHCSVALAIGERIFSHDEMLERRHNEALLSILDDLFKQADVPPRDLDLLGFTAGPGSFTGIRLAAAVVQALALVAAARVVPLPADEILYTQVRAKIDDAETVVCSIKSRGELYYLSEFRDGKCTQPLVLTDAPPKWLADSEIPVHLVGVRPPWWSHSATAELPVVVNARTMLGMTRKIDDEGRSKSAQFALPTYYQGDSPWQKQEVRS